ncbi:MAG: type II CAAX endopeptidase family protein [Deltaproteobacteria bacterium]|nr:type II CAAX endopeptidase family protein [Deltaproteobacteria bacterium]
MHEAREIEVALDQRGRAPSRGEPGHGEPMRGGCEASKMERLLPGVSPELVRGFLVSAVLLVLYRFHCNQRFYAASVGPWLGIDSHALFGFPAHGWKAFATFVLFFAVPIMVVRFADKRALAEVGLGPGDVRTGLKWTAILVAAMAPVVGAASFVPSFADHYPLAKSAGSSVTAFVAYEGVMLAYFVAWEFFFRGYMLFTLHRHIGNAAILVQTIPFALLHGSKPEPEALGAILVGVLLGWLALRTRSFAYCAAIHFLVALGMDLAATAQRAMG